MSNKIEIPPDIDVILDKPGREWMFEERDFVKLWLHEPPQLRELLLVARHHLGSGTTREDAEDAWGNFFLNQLDSVIDGYDPARGLRFWRYLLFCFKRFCHDEGGAIRKVGRRAFPLVQGETDEGDEIQLELVDDKLSNNPLWLAQQEEFLRALNKALEKLNSQRRSVFVLCDCEGRSYKEAAETLGVPLGTIKGTLHRARRQLREHLLKEGWL